MSRVQNLHLISAVKLVWKSNAALTVVTASMMVLQGVLPIIPLYVVKLIVDAIQAGSELNRVIVLVAVAGGAMLLSSALQAFSGYFRQAQSRSLSDYVQGRIHDKSLQLGMTYYEGPDFFDKLHRAQEEAPFRPGQVIDNLMVLLRSGITIAGIVGVLVYALPWWTVPALVGSALPLGAVRFVISRRFFKWEIERTPDERRVYYLNWLLTDRASANEVRTFALGELFKRRSAELRRTLRQEFLALLRQQSYLELFASALQTLAVVALLGYLAYDGVRGAASLGNVVLFFQSVQRGQQVLAEILRGVGQLYETNLFLSTVFEFFSLEPDVKFPSPSSDRPDHVTADIADGVTVENLTFHYPNNDRLVVDDVTLSMRKGEIVALVGDNGAGKTTLIKLLCRFYDPVSGRIAIDGRDIREFTEPELRAMTSVLFQDVGCYHYSARENIWFGDVSATCDEKRLLESAETALAHEFLAELDNGYDTRLGRWIEEGAELSGGQWKRVAIARAVYRDAPLVILDEPTAGVDPDSEARFVDSLRAIARDRCLLLVSHRIPPIRQADRTYVMQEGRIIEQGSHDELIATNGYYATMFLTQMRQMQGGRSSE